MYFSFQLILSSAWLFILWFLFVEVLPKFYSTSTLKFGENPYDHFFEFFFKRFSLFIFRERGRVGEREGEKLRCGRDTWIGCLSQAPSWGPGLQPRPVPWLGIKPATFWFASLPSTHWATPARAVWILYQANYLTLFPYDSFLEMFLISSFERYSSAFILFDFLCLYKLDKIALSPSLEKVALYRSNLCVGCVYRCFWNWVGVYGIQSTGLLSRSGSGWGGQVCIVVPFDPVCSLCEEPKWAQAMCPGIQCRNLAGQPEHPNRTPTLSRWRGCKQSHWHHWPQRIPTAVIELSQFPSLLSSVPSSRLLFGSCFIQPSVVSHE